MTLSPNLSPKLSLKRVCGSLCMTRMRRSKAVHT